MVFFLVVPCDLNRSNVNYYIYCLFESTRGRNDETGKTIAFMWRHHLNKRSFHPQDSLPFHHRALVELMPYSFKKLLSCAALP